MSLPTEKSIPKQSLSDYLIMLYGRQGIGKTSLAAQFPNALCLMMEPGAKSLSIYKEDVLSWKKLRRVVDDLYNEKHSFKTIVLDTYPQAYELCSQYVCDENGWESPGDKGLWGRGWDAVYGELSKQMNRLISKFGVVLTAHEDTKEVEQLDGTIKEKVVPDMKNQAMRFISRSVDLLGYYYSRHEKRFIRIIENDEVMAKNRIKGHFMGVSKFEAGNSEEEAYQNLISAFNNVHKENTNGKEEKGVRHKGVLLFRKK